MGRFYPEISIDRGLSVRLKRARVRRSKKKGERLRDDPTTISVRDMTMAPGQMAGRFFVRSSNLADVQLAAGWPRAGLDRLEKRRQHADGGPKGRILYGVLETPRETLAIASLCYHYEQGTGEIEISSIDVTSEFSLHRSLLESTMVAAAGRIALEVSKSKSGRLVVELGKAEARKYRDLGFKNSGRASKNRVRLSKEIPRPTVGARGVAARS